MRRLELTYALTQRGLPVLVAAVLTPAAGCGGDTDRDTGVSTSDAAGGTEAGGSGSGSLAGAGNASGGLGPGAGGSAVIGSGGTTGGAAGATTTIDPRYEFTDGGAGGPTACLDWEEPLIVPLPPEGTLAEPTAICAEPEPVVESGWAARVTLDHGGVGSLDAVGRIEIVAGLQGRVVGVPEIGIADTPLPAASGLRFSNMRADGSGYTFDATWTGSDPLYSVPTALELVVTLQIRCDEAGETTRLVEVYNALYLCGGGNTMPLDDAVWVSPGDDCAECPSICEMAPSPIVPEPRQEDLPLASALRLGLRLVARVGESLVLLAEHDGGNVGIEYRWQLRSLD